jgi:hypothetical protein
MDRGHLATLGFATHSGWAAVVAVAREGAGIRVLARERVEMTDTGDPGSKQPYHTVEGRPLAEAERRLRAYSASAERMAHESVARLVEEIAARDHRVKAVGILESSGRKGASLADTLASHALIHTADGGHFRDALAAAAGGEGLAVTRVRARELEDAAATAIGRPGAALARQVKELGREVGPPWGADQKAAALLAWLVLARLSDHRWRR